jgi:hypothetical protein
MLSLRPSRGDAHVAETPKDALDALCQMIVKSNDSNAPTTQLIFLGDSTALQVLRLSVRAVLTCLQRNGGVDELQLTSTSRLIEGFHKRIAQVGVTERIVLTALNGHVWTFTFVKSRYLGELGDALQEHVACSAGRTSVLIACGTWDIARPVLPMSGLSLSSQTTSSGPLWRRALSNFSSTLRRHADHVVHSLQLGNTVACGRNIRVLLPILPNCTADKFHRVLEGRSTSTDPYANVQGSDCRSRLVLGTAPVVRRTLHRLGSIGSVSVVDPQALFSPMTSRFVSRHSLASFGGACVASDGAHLDDLSQRIPLLTPCTLRVLRRVWDHSV